MNHSFIDYYNFLNPQPQKPNESLPPINTMVVPAILNLDFHKYPDLFTD